MTGPAHPLRSASPRWWPAVALLVAAVAVRWPMLGALDMPGTELDPQLYLLIGDRVLHGDWPVLDVWDRKPPGLFLLYAFARLFGGIVLPYQLLALAFAWGGALLVRRIARRTGGGLAGVAAGLLYLVWQMPLGGDGGQSPVFYDAIVAAAALRAIAAFHETDARRVARSALWAAALGGLAMQIKYTALPEAAALAGLCLWRLRILNVRATRLAGVASCMAIVGAAPTLLVMLAYAIHGGLGAFWYADVVSILDRGRMPADMVRDSGLMILLVLSPLLLLAPLALATSRSADRVPLMVWLAGAAAGTAMIGTFYPHYALPLVAPLCVAVAPLVRRSAAGVVIAAALVASPLVQAGWPHREPQGGIAALTAAVRPYLGPGRCLFVYDGTPLLYLTTRSCLPSRIVSPDHFANAVEAPALGLDIAAETARVLAARPAAIVTTSAFVIPLVNRATYALVARTLARDYVRVAAVRSGGRVLYVDVRRDRPHPANATPARMVAPLPRHTLAAARTGLAFP